MYQYIEDLPPRIRSELEYILDHGGQTCNWRSLVELMPGNMYKCDRIEGFAMVTLQPNGSPTEALLDDLTHKRITVQQLVSWIHKLVVQAPNQRLQSLLLLLEPLKITRQPDDIYRQPLGSSFYIKCEAATSFPVSYQWFKRKDLLTGQTQKFLHLQDVCKQDEGYYICRVAFERNVVFSKYAKVEIEETDANLAAPNIISQTPSSNVRSVLGETLRLYCDAVGVPCPTFQWYKNDRPITNATEREFKKSNICIDDEGLYLCIASNSSGVASSDRMHVVVDKHQAFQASAAVPRGEFETDRVSGKIALLIGNKDYKNHDFGKLYHPMNDVCDLAGALRSIGFKVVSLVNLTLAEMRFAVHQFYKLLNKDMYAVFYFAGHGFEVGNQTYLMPVDATEYSPEQNFSASEVIRPMQSTKAKLNVILLDSCRTRPQGSTIPTEGLDVKEKNVIIVFGCCPAHSVFECKDQKNGYFALYLLKHIGEDRDIEMVLTDVSGGIDRENIRDPKTRQKQLVYRHSTKTETLSLLTPVESSETAENTIKDWKAAHEIPEIPVRVFEENDIIVELRFTAEFSNVLIVNARIQGGNGSSVAFCEPEKFDGCVMERIHEKGQESDTLSICCNQTVRIRNLQRLKDHLVITLDIKSSSETQVKRIKHKMKEQPLYAKLVHAEKDPT